MALVDQAFDAGMFRARDEKRREVNRQLHENQRAERVYRRAYRDGMRRGDYRQAMDAHERAMEQGVNFSGIKPAGSSYATAERQVDTATAGMNRMNQQRQQLDSQLERDRLRGLEADAKLEAEGELGALRSRVAGFAPRPGMSDLEGQFNGLIDETADVAGVMDPGARRLGLRQRLHGLSGYYDGSQGSREAFGSMFTKLGIDPEAGFTALDRRNAEEQRRFRTEDQERDRLSTFDTVTRTAEIRREKEAELGKLAKRAGGLNTREARTLINRI